MKKNLILTITLLYILCLCSCTASSEKPTGTSTETEGTKNTIEVVEETTTEATEETTTEYIDPQCTDPYNGMVVRPNPDQYIDTNIYYLSFNYTEQQGKTSFWVSVDINGTTFSCSTEDGKSVDVQIDEEHAQMIFDELSKYKFYYWDVEDYQTVDENGVIAQTNPPYQFYIYSSQFWNTTEIKMNEEDIEAFLAYVEDYTNAIYESQKEG